MDMDVYVYDSPNGPIADFRTYLDGVDNAFDPPRPLKPTDPRWEKVHTLLDPRTGEGLNGRLRFSGLGRIDDYHDLMVFPIAYEGKAAPKGS